MDIKKAIDMMEDVKALFTGMYEYRDYKADLEFIDGIISKLKDSNNFESLNNKEYIYVKMTYDIAYD